MVRLTCVAEAFPNPEYLWVRADGETIRDDILTNASSLMITSIEYGDQGGYFCNASAREETAVSQVAVITGKISINASLTLICLLKQGEFSD
jgi:hypothetical protein